MTPLLKNMISPISAFTMPPHRKEREIRMCLHYFPPCLLLELSLAPAWGKSTDPASLGEMLQVQERRAMGMTHRPQMAAENKDWEEK